MHLIWISDGPTTPSGFGNVTRFVCEGLARRGHRVSILSWQAHEPSQWNGCDIYPIGRHALGADALFAYLIRHRPQVVIALADIWWLPYLAAPHVRRQLELIDAPWLLYFPVDGNTADGRLPPSWIELLQEVDVPIAMSRYGQSVAQACGVRSEYIPHGVDLETFSPPADREQLKAERGAAGKFVVLSDSRNQPRKLMPRLLDTFARFADGKPDVLLHLHTDPDDDYAHTGYYSYDIRADIRHLGLEDKVRFSPSFSVKPGSGLPLQQLASYYQAADVHLLASSGEGFGLPTLQAAAAGAVPMACAYSASLELVQGHGAAIDVEDWSENEFGIRRALISTEDGAAKLSGFYRDRAILAKASAASRAFAISYGWEPVIGMWDDLLTSIGRKRQRIAGSSRRVEVARPLETRLGSTASGVSITVKMVARDAGRLEASIAADARRQSGDVRLPAVQRACRVSGLKVPRRQSYCGLSVGDHLVFSRLKAIFPALSGWCLGHPNSALVVEDADLEIVCDQFSSESRYRLAQTVLLLNLSGGLPEPLLIDAALFGVACIGQAVSQAQTNLWPELAVSGHAGAIAVARDLLTNAARLQRLSSAARERCVRHYTPDESEASAGLSTVATDDLALAVGA